MREALERTERVIGSEGVDKLAASSVIVFGVGGVGSYVVEGLARAGIGSLCIVDKDTVDITNINRQIPALHSTVGMEKVQVMAERIRDINPDCNVDARCCFYMPENKSDLPVTADQFDFSKYDYCVDAVDNITAKTAIIQRAYECGTPVISSMGTGNKLDPSAFRITTIEKTKVCPLAKVMRKKLKELGIKGIKVIYSEEEPVSVGGSISFVPSVAGLMIAGEVVRDLIKDTIRRD